MKAPKLMKGISGFKDNIILQMMILPSIVIAIVINYFPVYGLIIAFKRYNITAGIWESAWAANNGFEHFIDFFNAPQFGNVLRNTLAIAFLKLFFLQLPPVILAIMINEIRNAKFKRLTQSISYMPRFISWVIIGGFAYNFLNPSNGLFNVILVNLNIISKPINFLSDNIYFWPIVVLSDFWRNVGYSSIIFLAAIAAINQELYDALEIDGGGRWAKIIHIIWPSVKGTFMILFILQCGKIMEGTGSTFQQSYILGNVTNRKVSDVLDTYILRIGLENMRYSFAAAAGLFKSIVNLILLLSANWLSKKITAKSLF